MIPHRYRNVVNPWMTPREIRNSVKSWDRLVKRLSDAERKPITREDELDREWPAGGATLA